MNHYGASAVHINLGSFCNIQVVGGYVNRDLKQTGIPAPGKLYELGFLSCLKLKNTQYDPYAIDPENSDVDVYEEFENMNGTMTFRRKHHLGFVGVDNANNIQSRKDNAIFFGLGDLPTFTSDGINIAYVRRNKIADILISRNPAKIGGIGWVNAWDNAATVTTSGTVTNIAQRDIDQVLTFTDVFPNNYSTTGEFWYIGLTVSFTGGATAIINSYDVAANTIFVKDVAGTINIGDTMSTADMLYWARASYQKIPIIQGNISSLRPMTDLRIGQQYFDTTLRLSNMVEWNRVG
jgi:hypothetical protein